MRKKEVQFQYFSMYVTSVKERRQVIVIFFLPESIGIMGIIVKIAILRALECF